VSDRFDELLGGVEDPGERERLRRVHELLLAVDPPPDVSPAAASSASGPELVLQEHKLSRRRRPLLLAAALAALLAVAAFGAGFLAGDRAGEPETVRVIPMSGVGPERDAAAEIELLEEDAAGNWPMRVVLRGLEPSRDRDDWYELWLTSDGELTGSCGRFMVNPGETAVTLTVPYGLRAYDGWVVTRRGSSEVLLST
jgi:hypothetical protein